MNNISPAWAETIAYAVIPYITLMQELPWLAILVQIALAGLAVMILHRFGTHILERVAAPFPFSRRLVRYGHRPGRTVVFFLLMQVILRSTGDTLTGMQMARTITALFTTAALTWLAVRLVKAAADTIVELNPADTPDNLHARRIQTQTKVLSRTIMVLIVLVGSGLALMTLPMLRQLGTSLLASAGVAGLVIGLAAKPVLGNLLAGLQLALTQPIRLEDVVIVQNEWGHVEEITSTYVVIRVWDLRRMIVPLQWFIENPFQNWTRTNSDLLGTVILWVDYRMPLDPLRDEAKRICADAPEWDGVVCMIQVTEAGERAKQLRVLVSAGDAGRCWDLRCRVREGLLEFVQSRYPEYLPRVRIEADSEASANALVPPRNTPA